MGKVAIVQITNQHWGGPFSMNKVRCHLQMQPPTRTVANNYKTVLYLGQICRTGLLNLSRDLAFTVIELGGDLKECFLDFVYEMLTWLPHITQ